MLTLRRDFVFHWEDYQWEQYCVNGCRMLTSQTNFQYFFSCWRTLETHYASCCSLLQSSIELLRSDPLNFGPQASPSSVRGKRAFCNRCFVQMTTRPCNRSVCFQLWRSLCGFGELPFLQWSCVQWGSILTQCYGKFLWRERFICNLSVRYNIEHHF